MDIISKIFIAENAICVYRNFSFLNKKRKILAVICITYELGFITYGFCDLYRFVDAEINMDTVTSVTLGFIARVNGLLIICLAFKNAGEYKILCHHISAAYDQIKACDEIQTSFKKVKICGIVMSIVFVISNGTMGARFIYDVVTHMLPKEEMTIFNHLYTGLGVLQFILAEYRYFIELVSLIIFIYIVSVSFKFLNLTIAKISKSIKIADFEVAHSRILSELRTNIEKCATIAHHLSVCRDQLTKCFNVQIAYALFVAIVYFIIVAYKGITSLISQAERNKVGSSNTILLLSNYMLVPIVMMLAGQAVQNEARKFDKALAQLQNTLLTVNGDGVADLKKLVNDFHRQILVNPVGIKILSEVILHMPMVPDILSAIIGYTIVLLQFNHVL